MAFFKDLLAKLGFKPKATTATPVAKPTGNVRPVTGVVGKPTLTPLVKATPMEMVDVVAKMEKLAAANPQKLNWKTSIVDLLKLLDIDSSLTSRKELATELGCPAAKMADSAEMNMWLHKAVLRKLAENGGNVPASLLD